MARERQHRADIQAETLPVADFDSFCRQLLEEGLGYDELPEGKVVQVGKHTSILLHHYPQKEGRWVSLHFREGLESSTEGKMKLGRVRDFHKQIGADLQSLSKRLLEDFGDVDMIYGLTQVSANWGGNRGFDTRQFTKDPEIIRKHVQSITGMPPQTNDKAPLTLFAIGRNELFGEFYGDGPSAPKEPVVDSVGN